METVRPVPSAITLTNSIPRIASNAAHVTPRKKLDLLNVSLLFFQFDLFALNVLVLKVEVNYFHRG